jgi:alanine racemase
MNDERPATQPPHAAELTIDLGAIRKNWQLLRGQARPGVDCAAVVKADAYGLGATRVASALYQAGCRDFFVALVDEALTLRPFLPLDARLFVLHGPLPGAEPVCAQAGVIPVLNSREQIQAWSDLALRLGRTLPAAVQFDTGMARLGLARNDPLGLGAEEMRGIEPVLLMSHLVGAEDPQDSINPLQLQRFQTIRQRWAGVPASLANSSGVFLGQDFHADLLRPGAALYGIAPTLGRPNPMHPVLRLTGRLIQSHWVEAGEGVGYNHTWTASRRTRVATVSVGYADGYLRSLGNRARLHIRGQPVALIGRVSMDTVTVDVTEVPEPHLAPGAPVELIGQAHDINALADEAGTNAYEILTSLGPRYQITYIDS